jgi:hypothetical protein
MGFMKNSEGKERAYLKCLKKLRALIEKEYRDGGWLPPGREMSHKFNVSHLTYRKALKLITDEGAAVSYVRKGHYVKPAYQRLSKIGFVVDSGQESPYIHAPELVSSAMAFLASRAFQIHLIQAAVPENIPATAARFGVSGMIWFHPPRGVRPVVEEIAENNYFPVVVAELYDPLPWEERFGKMKNVPTAGLDYIQMGSARASYFIDRGHRKIAYLGHWMFAEMTGLPGFFEAGGVEFGPECCIQEPSDIKVKLPELIADGVTGVISEGGLQRTVDLMDTVSALPLFKRPEIIVRDNMQLKNICSAYPNIKISGTGHTDTALIGKTATRMLADNLRYGLKIRSESIKAFRIIKFSETDEVWKNEV